MPVSTRVGVKPEHEDAEVHGACSCFQLMRLLDVFSLGRQRGFLNADGEFSFMRAGRSMSAPGGEGFRARIIMKDRADGTRCGSEKSSGWGLRLEAQSPTSSNHFHYVS